MTMHVLFLCTGNSARSQMSEGFARALGDSTFEFHSAGTCPSREVHPLAVRAMAEIGIDISGHKTKNFTQVPQDLSFIVSVCGKAAEECPVIPGLKNEAWDLDDPAAAEGSEERRMAVFRRVRDEIEGRVTEWLARHGALQAAR
ncbi:MAG: arsenate reductase ArsC [Chthonomonadaceae bacterium]|nr:MAG: arsenate reductase ArsC [Chthonomonadaceae bacterium]